jgi:hypothetical protein
MTYQQRQETQANRQSSRIVPSGEATLVPHERDLEPPIGLPNSKGLPKHGDFEHILLHENQKQLPSVNRTPAPASTHWPSFQPLAQDDQDSNAGADIRTHSSWIIRDWSMGLSQNEMACRLQKKWPGGPNTLRRRIRAICSERLQTGFPLRWAKNSAEPPCTGFIRKVTMSLRSRIMRDWFEAWIRRSSHGEEWMFVKTKRKSCAAATFLRYIKEAPKELRTEMLSIALRTKDVDERSKKLVIDSFRVMEYRESHASKFSRSAKESKQANRDADRSMIIQVPPGYFDAGNLNQLHLSAEEVVEQGKETREVATSARDTELLRLSYHP